MNEISDKEVTELIKALRVCGLVGNCKDCPRDMKNYVNCDSYAMLVAADFLEQQREAIIGAKAIADIAGARIKELESEFATVKAERDAAVAAITPNCRFCVNAERCFSEPSANGNYKSYHHCHANSMCDFKWRATQPAGKNTHE